MKKLYCPNCKSEFIASYPLFDECRKLISRKVDCKCLNCGKDFKVKASKQIAAKWRQIKQVYPNAEVVIDKNF